MILVKSIRLHLLELLAIGLMVEFAYMLIFMPVSRFAVVVVVRASLQARYAKLIPLSFLWLAFGITFNMMLKSLNWRWLEWRLSKKIDAMNIVLVPLRWKWLWVPCIFLIVGCLPIIAFLEEYAFRAGTTNWIRGILWCALAFGLLHLISLVSVRMVIYLSLVGAFLADVYMRDGLVAVFVVHTAYDVIVVFLVVIHLHVMEPLSTKYPIMRRWTNRLNSI
jgi:hypothetical protein